MTTPYEITTASQLDPAVRDALVDYIQISRVTDWFSIKNYADARYRVMLRNTAIMDLVQRAGVLSAAPSIPSSAASELEPEPALAVKPKVRERRIE